MHAGIFGILRVLGVSIRNKSGDCVMTHIAVAKLHVLYVDDDPTNLAVLHDMLSSLGSAVALCRTPTEALELLRCRPFHLVLADIHMPEMSGIEFVARLRHEFGPNRATPTIALTADLSRDELQYQALGFDGFLAKPILLKSLLAKILDVLTRQQEAQARVAPDAKIARAG
jgi:CheY-like chemotaxis protein